MNKNEIYVPINSKKEAKQAKAVLKALGEKISDDGFFEPDENRKYLVFSGSNNWCIFSLLTLKRKQKEKEEITLKQLIELLVSEVREPVKIAVKVENDKEFKALMKYYDSLGYNTTGFTKMNGYDYIFIDDCDCLSQCSKPHLNISNRLEITFSEFAKEHNIKLPLITSEDGVDLFYGDQFYTYFSDKNTVYGPHVLQNLSSCLVNPSNRKAFNTKRAALDWIESQEHKILSHTFNPSCNVIVDSRGVDINDGGLGIRLTNGMFHKIRTMMEELKNA